MRKFILSVAILLPVILMLAGCASWRTPPADAVFNHLPPGCDPTVVGEKVAHNFLQRKIYRNTEGFIVYPEVCAAFGALRFADITGDQTLEQQLIQRYAFILTPAGSSSVSTKHHVDFSMFGALPLEIYLLNGDQRYRDFGLRMADDQWASPRPDGLTTETRWWADDSFMITILQIQAYRATHDPKYADRAANELVAYLNKLQQPNGLFFHTATNPHFWGRGNGWVAVALAEALSSLPPDQPQYARLMAGYKQMMAALRLYQAPSGLWRQLVDDPQAYDETSGSGMFTYALIVGIKHGWLDPDEFGDVARRAWIGLCDHINADGNIRDVCIGTNQKDSTQYYLDRPRATGDLHGQAPILWCAWALLEK